MGSIQTITYTLTFSNAGGDPAGGVVITDYLPVSVTVQSVISSGDVAITNTLSSQTFEVLKTSKVSSGQGGLITITATISDPLAAGVFTNTATITTTTVESDTANNDVEAGLTVSNVAPVLAATGNQTIPETQPFTMTISATDADLPANTLSYTMMNTPTGAALDENSGLFSWTPDAAQGPGDYQITFTVSDDGSPVLTDSETITITVYDAPGVIIAQSGGSTDVTEGSITDTYQIVLNSPPTGTVTVTVTSDSQVNPSPGSLTFTTLNWDTPQTVTVTAVDDAIYEGNHTGAITHTAASADTGYFSYGYGSGSGSASEVFTVISNTTPPTFTVSPALITPTGGIVITGTQKPTLDWKDATDDLSGVVSYTLWISSSNNTISLQEAATTTTITLYSTRS